MRSPSPKFRLNQSERNGLFYVLVIFTVLKSVSWVYSEYLRSDPLPSFEVVQETSLAAYDRDRSAKARKTLRPFNYKYLDDYKGYLLGLSPVMMDKLNAHKDQGKTISDLQQMGRVGEIPDSLLTQIAPYLRFYNKKKTVKAIAASNSNVVRDINQADLEALKSIKGIGAVLGTRILKFRKRLGGFKIDAQLYDVYGLDSVVVQELLKNFRVKHPAVTELIDLNRASRKELLQIAYLRYAHVGRIIRFRDSAGSINSWQQLGTLLGEDSIRIDRIRLYLTIKKVHDNDY